MKVTQCDICGRFKVERNEDLSLSIRRDGLWSNSADICKSCGKKMIKWIKKERKEER